MATRMQQRRGTASQWISSNAGSGPILNAGEIGWESDTNKFKIGDGVSYWANLDYFSDVNSTVNPAFGSSITFEGTTANDYETTLQVTDPTADRTITLPNVDGTVITTGNLSDITNIGVFTSTITMEGSSADDNELTLSAGNPTADRTLTFPDATDTLVGKATTDTLTNKSISLTTNTVTGTTAEFNSALSDSNFVTTGDTGTVTSTMIADGTIVNGDINASAAIAQSKIDGLTTDLAAKAPLAAPALTGDATAVNLTISGNLTVNGTTTNINSTNLVIEDKNIVLADVETPTDTTANGGGITLKGATDKTLNWVDATDAWTSSEDFNLLTGKVYEINGTSVLSGSTLGSGVTASSLTSVGTITSGTWSATTIATTKGGTGLTSYTAGDIIYSSATDTLAKLAKGTDGQVLTLASGIPSWATAASSGADELWSIMGVY